MRLIIIVAVVSLAIAAKAGQIDALIESGQFSEAYKQLLQAYEKSPDKPEYLFLMGRSTQSGESSATFFKDFLKKSAGDSHLANWARLYLGKYYLAQSLYVTARKHFEDVPPSSPFFGQASYLAARCLLLSAEYSRAQKAFSDIIDRSPVGETKAVDNELLQDYNNWSILGLGDIGSATGDYDRAIRNYRQLLQPSLEENVFALALLGLAETSKKMGRWDDASRYFHLYLDRYHSGIKPIDLEADIIQTQAADSDRADKILGAKYYIQVGVFSRKTNAKKVSALYKKSGYHTIIENFVKEGKEFHRVLVGGYASKQRAEFVRKRLEKAAGERYFLLVR